MRKIVIACFFFLIVASDWAWSKNKEKEVEFIPKSFSTSFVQEFKSLLRKKIKRSNGKIDYQYPSNIRFEMKGKTDLTFVSNSKTSWYYRPSKIKDEPGQLDTGKSSKYNYAQFFDVLKHGLKSNNNYTVTVKGNEYNLSFAEKVAKKLKLIEAVLVFNKGGNKFSDLKAIHLVRKKGKLIKMIFVDMKINNKFSVSHFIFKAPEGTRIAN